MPDVAALMRGLLMANTATALVPMFVLVMGVVELLKRRWQRDGEVFTTRSSACAVGALSVLLGNVALLWHRAWLQPNMDLSLLHGRLGLDRVANALACRRLVRCRVVAACFDSPNRLRPLVERAFPWQLALLVYATVAVGTAWLCARKESLGGLFSRPLFHAALASSVATMPMIAASASIQHSGLLAWRACWVAALCSSFQSPIGGPRFSPAFRSRSLGPCSSR
jgi:hypothetical protein